MEDEEEEEDKATGGTLRRGVRDVGAVVVGLGREGEGGKERGC